MMGNPGFTIRPARPGEEGDLLHVQRRAILGLARESYTQAELQSWAGGTDEDFYGAAIRGPHHLEVAVDDAGTVIGFAAVRRDEVWLLYIDPDWARRGVGAALLARAEGHLRDGGHAKIWVQASLNARAFYAAQGYQDRETYPAATPGGVALSCLRMTKTLA